MRLTLISSSRWRRWSASRCSPTPSSSTCITASDASSRKAWGGRARATAPFGPARRTFSLAFPRNAEGKVLARLPQNLCRPRLHQIEQRVERAPGNEGVDPGLLVAVPLIDHGRQAEDHEAAQRKRDENGDRGEQPERCVGAALADIDQEHLTAPRSHDDGGPDRRRSERHQEGVTDHHSNKTPALLTRILGAGRVKKRERGTLKRGL